MSTYEKNNDGTYVDLEYTRFPAEVDGWVNSEDVTASMVGPANQYRTAMAAGRYAEAQTILTQYPGLKNMVINADTINRMKHSIMATERYYKEDVQKYILDHTEAAKTAATTATDAATEATASAKLSSQNRDESAEMLENLRTLKGSLPKTFEDYTKDVADARNYITGLVDTHNTSTDSHADIREKLNALDGSMATHKHSVGDITSGVLPIERGGTGASTAANACASIGAMPLSGGLMSGIVYLGSMNYYINNSGDANFRRAYGAVYNDYAELFPRGGNTIPGDIIALDTDSQKERYVKATDKHTHVVGVHTDEFAMLIGGEIPKENAADLLNANIEKYIPVSLAGRVRTRVIGPVKCGDYIIPSGVPGVGRAVKKGETVNPELIVGYAVEGDDKVSERRIRVRVRG